MVVPGKGQNDRGLPETCRPLPGTAGVAGGVGEEGGGGTAVSRPLCFLSVGGKRTTANGESAICARYALIGRNVGDVAYGNGRC